MKSIAVYTSTRADYGLLKPLIQSLRQQSDIETRIFATGTHFDKNFGNTIKEIEEDFSHLITYRVEHLINEDRQLKNTLSMSDALQKYSMALATNPPDIAVVLGDRFEALAFTIACASLNIPLAHIHGGEITVGAIDDKFRHCMTKLSNWHFTSCEKYKNRVIQLGENPSTVFNVGALGVENTLHQKLFTKEELEQNLKIQIPNELYLFTFHPETNSADSGVELLNSFLNTLEKRLVSHNALVILTGVNNDFGSQKIKTIINQFKDKLASKAFFIESLGLKRYLSVMKIATAVLGNSSSGVIEAHSLKTPAVNLGSRQEGRERESSVIDLLSKKDCENFEFSQLVKIKSILSQTNDEKSKFGSGQTSKLITETLVSYLKKPIDTRKVFFDLDKII